MIFKTFELEEDMNRVQATAVGHADEVVKMFRAACALILGGQGPWRITYVHGSISNDEFYDSEMKWHLIAKRKTVE